MSIIQKKELNKISVQDQVNEKNITLIIKSGKISGRLLAKAMKMFLEKSKNMMKDKVTNGIGKQTVKQLTHQGVGVSNIEISDKNIKVFESVARKYGVDFALTKDKTETPPKWLVFFKGRDADAITAAFKEFSAKQLKHITVKPSIIKTLRNLVEKVANQVLDKTKNKNKEREH